MILKQIEDVVVRISDEDYARPLSVLSDASVGQHIRHIIEFFTCLENGCREGVVNYDLRARDKQIEMDRKIAITAVRRIRDFVFHHRNQESLVLEQCYLPDAGFSSIPTSYLRELTYVIEHAVHHLAIIKIGLREVGMQVDEHFGVAASTIRHKKRSIESGNSYSTKMAGVDTDH